MAATAAQVLRRWSRLPRIDSVDVSNTTTGGAGFRWVVALQLHWTPGLPAMVEWARVFNAPVRFVMNRGYVGVTTETVVNGHVVLVWDHLARDKFTALVDWLDVAVPELDGQVEITTDNLLAAIEAVAGD